MHAACAQLERPLFAAPSPVLLKSRAPAGLLPTTAAPDKRHPLPQSSVRVPPPPLTVRSSSTLVAVETATGDVNTRVSATCGS